MTSLYLARSSFAGPVRKLVRELVGVAVCELFSKLLRKLSRELGGRLNGEMDKILDGDQSMTLMGEPNGELIKSEESIHPSKILMTTPRVLVYRLLPHLIHGHRYLIHECIRELQAPNSRFSRSF